MNLIIRPHSWGGYYLDPTGGEVPSWFDNNVWAMRWGTFAEALSWAVREEGGSRVERAATAASLSRDPDPAASAAAAAVEIWEYYGLTSGEYYSSEIP